MRSPLRRFKAEFFKALAHPGRIVMVDALRTGERSVGELQVLLEQESASASQHLAILRSKGIVQGRQEGNKVYYSVTDPKIFDLLDVARDIFNTHLSSTSDLLGELDDEEQSAKAAPTPGR
jgi:ArsR family transcriptional regulator